jgi:hypothetical protein
MVFDYVIIDVETGNEMDKSQWDNKKAEIVLVGLLFVKNNQIDSWKQLFRFNDSFKDNVTRIMSSLKKKQIPLFALNCNFEIDSLETLTGNRYEIADLRKNLKGTLSSKKNLFNFLLSKQLVPNVQDIYSENAALSIADYIHYQKSGDIHCLQRIAQHNLNCLFKEHFIKLNIEEILKVAVVNDEGFIKSL